MVAGACGLAVGTPIALLAVNSKLAKRGIIVKGRLQIENLKHTGIIVFDKTGTLTMGNPAVSQVIAQKSWLEDYSVSLDKMSVSNSWENQRCKSLCSSMQNRRFMTYHKELKKMGKIWIYCGNILYLVFIPEPNL